MNHQKKKKNQTKPKKAEDEVITQGKLPIKSEASVLKLSSVSYRVALDEDWPADVEQMVESEECPVIDFIPVDWRPAKVTTPLKPKQLESIKGTSLSIIDGHFG